MAALVASDVESGLLLIADVSGYTAYLSDVELEHSHDILADLVGAVAEALVARFEMSRSRATPSSSTGWATSWPARTSWRSSSAVT